MPRPAPDDDRLCLEVKVNGKKVALMGMRGQGGVSANIRTWRHVPGSNRTRTTKVRRSLDMHLGATDSNDATWDRFYSWPAPRLRLGDYIEVRVVRGTPDKAKFMTKYHRLREDEVPFKTNPSYLVVGDVVTWAGAGRVNLKAWNKAHESVSLTPSAARRVAKALVSAARHVERRERK